MFRSFPESHLKIFQLPFLIFYKLRAKKHLLWRVMTDGIKFCSTLLFWPSPVTSYMFLQEKAANLSLLQQRVNFLLHPSYQLGVYVLWTSKIKWNFIPVPCLCHEHYTSKMEYLHIPCSLVFFHVQESCSLAVPLLLNLVFIIKLYGNQNCRDTIQALVCSLKYVK